MEKENEDINSYMSTDYFRQLHKNCKNSQKYRKSKYILGISSQQKANKEIPMDHELKLAALRKKLRRKKK